jgi:hypothetical protein
MTAYHASLRVHVPTGGAPVIDDASPNLLRRHVTGVPSVEPTAVKAPVRPNAVENPTRIH